MCQFILDSKGTDSSGEDDSDDDDNPTNIQVRMIIHGNYCVIVNTRSDL